LFGVIARLASCLEKPEEEGMNMLYVGCSCCRSITPLWCAGRLMPHAPAPAVSIPGGLACQLCGPLAPIYTCTICWTTQMIYLPGSTSIPTQPMAGASQYIAPIVEARPNTDQHELTAKFSDVAKQALKGFAVEFAKGMGQNAASRCFQAWAPPKY
jgi:hypothetical protein